MQLRAKSAFPVRARVCSTSGGATMLDMAATAADRLGQILTDEFKRNFGSGHSDRAERLGSIARVAKIRRHAVELVALSPDVGIGGGPANIDSRIATIVPAQLRPVPGQT